MYRFISCLKENTVHAHYEHQSINAVERDIALYCENHMKHVHAAWQNEGTLDIIPGDKHSYQLAIYRFIRNFSDSTHDES